MGNIFPFFIPDIPGEPLIQECSKIGLACSTGSACSAGRKSDVMEAMQLADTGTMLRLSIHPEISETTWRNGVDRLAQAISILKEWL